MLLMVVKPCVMVGEEAEGRAHKKGKLPPPTARNKFVSVKSGESYRGAELRTRIPKHRYKQQCFRQSFVATVISAKNISL